MSTIPTVSLSDFYEEAFRLLCDHARVNFFFITKDGRCLFRNKSTEKFSGGIVEERVDLFDEEAWDNSKKVMESGKVQILEEQYRGPDESYKGSWFLSVKSPYYKEGKVAGLFGISLDITNQKKTEQALKEVVQKLENVLNTMPGHVYWKDKSGRYLGCNELQAKSLNLSKEELFGKTDYDILANPDEAEKVFNADQAIMKKGKPKIIEEVVEYPNKEKKIFLSSKTPFRDLDTNEIIGILGVSFDITDQRMTEQQLVEAEHKLEGMTLVSASIAHELRTPLTSLQFGLGALKSQILKLEKEKGMINSTTQSLENILDSIPGHIYWKDRNGAYLGCNALQAKNFGLTSREEIVGKTDYDLQWQETTEILREIDQKVVKTGQSITTEEPGICANDKIILTRKVPLHDEADESKIIGLLGISIDITNEGLAGEELKRVRNELEGVASVSEKIVKQLRKASFKSESDSLDSEAVETAATQSKITETLGAMEREVNLSTLVIDLLLENVNSTPERKHQVFSMKECINKALTRYPFKKNQAEKVRWNSDVDFLVEGKELLMTHILFNLLKNALYFLMKAGKGDITISLEKGEAHNVFYFKDTGTGIPKDMINHIFDRFFSKVDHGAGIGLTYCKMAAETLGGSIECDSVEGEYTLFKVILPVVKES